MAVLQAGNYDDIWEEESQKIVTADSLDRVEEKKIEQKQVAIDSLTSELTDSIEIASVIEQNAMHEEQNALFWRNNKDEYYDKVITSLTSYDQFKGESLIDDLELSYEQFKNDYTTSDGVYTLENYETYVQQDKKWNELYEGILPEGAQNFNPFWKPDPEKVAEFREWDLEKRRQYLDLNKQVDDLYDQLAVGGGEPTEEYAQLLDYRKQALTAITSYKLDVSEVLTAIKAENITADAGKIPELHGSGKNITNLIKELAETERKARASRVAINPMSIVGGPGIVPTMGDDGLSLVSEIEFNQMLGATESFEAASDLDPNLFDTAQGLYNAGWEDVADKGWFGTELEDEAEFVKYLMKNDINPQLWGYQPDDPEFRDLLIQMYKDEMLGENVSPFASVNSPASLVEDANNFNAANNPYFKLLEE